MSKLNVVSVNIWLELHDFIVFLVHRKVINSKNIQNLILGRFRTLISVQCNFTILKYLLHQTESLIKVLQPFLVKIFNKIQFNINYLAVCFGEIEASTAQKQWPGGVLQKSYSEKILKMTGNEMCKSLVFNRKNKIAS